MNEQLRAATRAFLKDWEGDGRSIIPIENLLKYGFSAPWLRDLAEEHQSDNSNPRYQIWRDGKAVDSVFGVYTLDLLPELISELGERGETELKKAAAAEGYESTHNMFFTGGRNRAARTYAAAIYAIIGTK